MPYSCENFENPLDKMTILLYNSSHEPKDCEGKKDPARLFQRVVGCCETV